MVGDDWHSLDLPGQGIRTEGTLRRDCIFPQLAAASPRQVLSEADRIQNSPLITLQTVITSIAEDHSGSVELDAVMTDFGQRLVRKSAGHRDGKHG